MLGRLLLYFSTIFLIILVKTTMANAQMKSKNRIIKVAAIQMNAVKFDKEHNFKKAEIISLSFF